MRPWSLRVRSWPLTEKKDRSLKLPEGNVVTTGAAIGVGLWCAIVVGTADNLLRPLLIGKDTEMSHLLVMVTTLGGLALFGAAVFVFGPFVGALFPAVWDLWGVYVEEAW